MADTILQNVYRNGHTYLLVDHGTSFTWAEAEAYAASLGGHLVTIDDAEEQTFVYGTFSDVGSALAGGGDAIWFWLGLNDVAVEGAFMWSSGSASTYTNWFAGQPNANNIPNQDYAAFFFFNSFDPQGQWFTIPDDDPNNYALALIELPFLLATTGDDIIEGGIGADLLAGGGGNDVLAGKAGNDRLEGSAGNDALVGGPGTDILIGGKGNDIYDIDDTFGSDADQFSELADQGIDTIVLRDAFTFTMPENFENLFAMVGDGHFVTGNALNNVMEGSADPVKFRGAGGADTLRGGSGNDRLEGGEGNDLIYGGVGDDSLFGDVGRDLLVGGLGIDSYVMWERPDRVVMNSVTEIGKGKTVVTRESIAKFDSGEHIVDLSGIDANGLAEGDGSFTFIGGKRFSGVAGQLRQERFDLAGQLSDYILVEGDVNGDGRADFRFQFDNFQFGMASFRLHVEDFIL